jgi:hypothetical protein
MKKLFFPLLFLLSLSLNAQKRDKGDKTFSSGVISLGARTTASIFNEGASGNGFGMGGQFRVQFGNHVNSDWFMDYITEPVGDFANRTDLHIGWSVLYYPTKYNAERPAFLRPYILAGHCFDYTIIRDNVNPYNFAERWSSAVQTGLGTHFNLTKRLDVSLTTQYMIHLGNDVLAEGRTNGTVIITEEEGASLEGHLLTTLSMNFKIADLW